MLYHDHAHNLVGCTSCSDALACNAKTYKQIYLSTAGKGLRTGEHYEHNMPLHNTEPIILKRKAEVNMVTTHAKSAEQEQLTPKLLDLQIWVRDIFKTLDKHQLIMNADKVLDSLDPAKLRELQDRDQSIINLKNSRKQSVLADNDNVLRIKVDHKGNTLSKHLSKQSYYPKSSDHQSSHPHTNSAGTKVEIAVTTK